MHCKLSFAVTFSQYSNIQFNIASSHKLKASFCVFDDIFEEDDELVHQLSFVIVSI
jgi:hypothetical protein